MGYCSFALMHCSCPINSAKGACQFYKKKMEEEEEEETQNVNVGSKRSL